MPDVPKKQDENVSSSYGQPDRESSPPPAPINITDVGTEQTRDNTAQNVGGSGGGYGDDSQGGDSYGDDNSGGKQKLTDKIKDKLPFGKKDRD